MIQGHIKLIGFNTQPPEGGWSVELSADTRETRFNTQPPEGGWREESR